MNIRVLVVDDSKAVVMVLRSVLTEAAGFEVVGTAGDGKEALEKLETLRPDIVTLDIEMPIMDGVQTLIKIRELYPKLPVIMISSLTQRGAIATLDALSLGATDYVPKPTDLGSLAAARQYLETHLVPKLRLFGGAAARPTQPRPATATAAPTAPAAANAKILAIGSSIGGPNALASLLCKLPAEFPAPVVIAQHMPPVFTEQLALRLDAISGLDVAEAEDGEELRPGRAVLAPGDYHMVVRCQAGRTCVVLNQDPPEHSCRPSVSVLLRSVAEAYGQSALAVVLTGMGSDGTEGCALVRKLRGQILVQDRESSVVWGMAGNVAEAGLADAIVPLDRMDSEIMRRMQKTR